MALKRMLAIDLGASSGRGIIGTWDGERITLEEIHRFQNDPVMMPGGFFWDVPRLLFDIKAAILAASHTGGVDTIGIDTWGVDYGYLDKAGTLLANPYHYRDTRTDDIQPYVEKNILPLRALYDKTGIQSMNFNTIYQLAADLRDRPWIVESAETLLMMPDLLGYMLTGVKMTEYTIASTAAMLDAKTRNYDSALLDTFGVPARLLCDVVQPGTAVGKLLPLVDEETGHTGATLVKVAGHDTASAVLAVPAENEDFLYISSGTWSLMGIESKDPIINDATTNYNVANEGGVFGTIRVLKNIMGLWLEQESRRQWKREGTAYSFSELSALAREVQPLQCFIDPDDSRFAPSGNMPRRIRAYCEETGQHVPETVGEVVRCILDSLALKYRYTAEMLEKLSGRTYSTINIVGGGTQEEMLSQFTADATHKTVSAGPIEATALGNIAMQCIASGEIADVWEARRIIRNSTEIKEYTPDVAQAEAWDNAYAKFCALLNR